MRLLEVEHLAVSYGKHEIVHDVGFSLEEGRWLMLIGPNGAGKSTILNAIAGSIAYTGVIRYRGQDMRTMKFGAFAKGVGMLAQNHYVEYAFSVAEVVRLGRYAYAPGAFSRPSGEDTAIVQKALALTGMEALSNQAVPTLSGGELQRAFLAQLLAQNPRVLLLDEPTNHLDPLYQKQLFSLLLEWLHAEEGRAILSVVHDLKLARAYGTDALLLKNGRTLANGAVETVFTKENLNRAYDMDVCAWMNALQRPWDETEKA